MLVKLTNKESGGHQIRWFFLLIMHESDDLMSYSAGSQKHNQSYKATSLIRTLCPGPKGTIPCMMPSNHSIKTNQPDWLAPKTTINYGQVV